MSKRKIVVALGHQALGTTLPEQKTAAKYAAKTIVDLVEAGEEVVISHSNAPQIGMIHTAMNEFGKAHPDFTVAPMSVCSAMSQGYIGYDLQNAIRAELFSRGIYKPVATILTQVKVNPYDEAFYEPSKIIGRYMTKEEAEEEEKKGNFVVEQEGGYRRIVAAPRPIDIIEIDTIRALVDAGQIVIACGGGGIPVLSQGVELRGASAVIEKDLSSGLLAEQLDADELLILTSVDNVSIGYGTDHEEKIGKISVEDAKKYIDAGEFEKNSMLPKIQASVDFVEQKADRRAIITSLKHAIAGVKGKTGTIIS